MSKVFLEVDNCKDEKEFTHYVSRNGFILRIICITLSSERIVLRQPYPTSSDSHNTSEGFRLPEWKSNSQLEDMGGSTMCERKDDLYHRLPLNDNVIVNWRRVMINYVCIETVKTPQSGNEILLRRYYLAYNVMVTTLRGQLWNNVRIAGKESNSYHQYRCQSYAVSRENGTNKNSGSITWISVGIP